MTEADSAVFRSNLIGLLQLLTSEQEQLDYERNVPHVDITEELVCMWFDDVYHPTSSLFQQSFTPREIQALEEFNKFYDLRAKKLPDSKGTVRTWLQSPIWREVMHEAQATLDQIKTG